MDSKGNHGMWIVGSIKATTHVKSRVRVIHIVQIYNQSNYMAFQVYGLGHVLFYCLC